MTYVSVYKDVCFKYMLLSVMIWWHQVPKCHYYTDDKPLYVAASCFLLWARKHPSWLLFFTDKLWKQEVSQSTDFGLSQLNCSSTTTDGLTAMTPSTSTLPRVITIPSPHLTFSPGSHPSCFSPFVSLLSALLIYFTHAWSHICTALSLKLSVTNHL